MPTVTVDITGAREALAKLDGLPGAVEGAIKKGLTDTAIMARTEAMRSIKSKKSGRIYEKWKPRRTHQASAPGEAPASDLGFLAQNIFVEPAGTSENPAVNLVARAPYAVHLEYGTTRIAPRPFLRPAADKVAPQGARIIAAYAQQIINGGKSTSSVSTWMRGVSLIPLVGSRG